MNTKIYLWANKRHIKTKIACAAFLFNIVGFVAFSNALVPQLTNIKVKINPDSSLTTKEWWHKTAVQQAKVDSSLTLSENDNWMLTLVNAVNPIPDGYAPRLKTISGNMRFDERAIDQLNAMLSTAKNQGLSPIVCSAFRSIEYQQTLFENQVKKQMATGLSPMQAEAEAKKHVAYPRTSEHNLGLAVDIVSLKYQLLDEKQANTPEFQWLLKHCYEYGFILRYPEGKESITGVIYEPWHFRYVGIQVAKEIMENGSCLEEYLADRNGGN